MKVRRGLPRFHNADILRQHGVEGVAELFRRDAGFGVEMRHLPLRMNACVGAGSAGDADRAAGQLAQCLFNHLLHSDRITLGLPARIRRSVVGDAQRDAARHSSLSSRIRTSVAAVTPIAAQSMA